MKVIVCGLSVVVIALCSAATVDAQDIRVAVGFNGPSDPALFAAHGGVPSVVLQDAVAGKIALGRIARLQAHPNVAYVIADPVATTCAVQELDWGVDRTDAEDVHADLTLGNKGAGVRVAIIDTGIRSTHEDLAGGVVAGKSWFKDADGNELSTEDDGQHGTHVAGIVGARDNTVGVVGVAPEASLVPAKVLNAAGSGSFTDILGAIDWASDTTSFGGNCKILNLSLGGTVPKWYEATINSSVNLADGRGALVVAAAGNSGINKKFWPAASPNAYAVAATGTTDKRASFSNHGSWVDGAAPGVSIKSSHNASDAAYVVWNGTSMASPMVAGTAALLVKQGIHTSPSGITVRLKATGATVAPDGTKVIGKRVDAENAVLGTTFGDN